MATCSIDTVFLCAAIVRSESLSTYSDISGNFSLAPSKPYCIRLTIADFPSLLDVTLDELATGLKSGLFMSTNLVSVCLARIAQANFTLHCVTEVAQMHAPLPGS